MQRFVWLDSVRGIAALIVVIFHYHHFYLTDYSTRNLIPAITTFPYSHYLSLLYSYGHYAVQLFWVISGFVFFHVYGNKEVSFKYFLVHRFARLYPLHFMTLMLVTSIQLVSMKLNGHWQIYGNNDPLHFILQLAMASNWITVSHGLSFNGPIWSVSLEVITYIIFFLNLVFIRKAPLFSALTLFMFSWLIMANYEHIWLLSSGVFTCCGYFFFGGLTYSFYSKCLSLKSNLLFIIIAIAVFLVITKFFAYQKIEIAIISSLIVFISAQLDRANFKPSVLKVLGDISYSIYLVHVPIQMICLIIFDEFMYGDRSFANSLYTLPIYLITVLSVAYFTHVYFEKPAGRYLKQKLL